MRAAKTLIRLDGYPDWSESSLGAQFDLSCCGLSLSCCGLSCSAFLISQNCYIHTYEAHFLVISTLDPSYGTLLVTIPFKIIILFCYFWLRKCLTKLHCPPLLCFWVHLSLEPRHEKTCFSHMRTTKVQISLRIRAVWSAPLLFATKIVQYLYLLNPKFQDPSWSL